MSFIWVILGSFLTAAFFSAAEMAFIAANRLKLRHLAEGGHRVAARYLEAFGSPERILAAAKMGVPVAHIVASSVATWGLLPYLGPASALVVTLVLTPIMLVLGEVIPKAIAQQWATGLILRLFRPLTWAAWLLRPLTWTAGKIVEKALSFSGRSREHVRQFVSREELKLVLQMNPEESDVTTQEAEMIDKIFDLGETKVREVMVPLVDMIAIPEEATVEEAITCIRERGFSRLPVYKERIDHIVGVVTAMDLFRRGEEAPTLKALMRPATYVPDTKRIDDLLGEMQKARTQLAVVVDEYGGGVGIVTLEDIIEEIVGEIEDEHDRRLTVLEPLPDGSYLAAGRTSVETVNEELDWNLPKGDYDTLGGLILSRLNRIPVRGEEVTVEDYHLTVVEADERRILKIKLKPPRPDGPGLSPTGRGR